MPGKKRPRSYKGRPRGTRNKLARSGNYIRPMPKRTFAKRKDIAKFTYNATFIWTPNPGHLSSSNIRTNFITVNATDPSRVLLHSNTQTSIGNQKYGGSGTLTRDDKGTTGGHPGDIKLDMQTGIWEEGAQSVPSTTDLVHNSVDMLGDYVGFDPKTSRYTTMVTKSCKIFARIIPERETTQSDGTTHTQSHQPTTNWFSGKSIAVDAYEDPQYMTADKTNDQMRSLPFVKQGQTFMKQNQAERGTFMAKGFSCQKMFGLGDVEDCDDLEIKATMNGGNIQYGTPNKKGFIQLGWRPVYDSEIMQPGYQPASGSGSPPTGPPISFPLPRHRIVLRVEYIVQLKDPIPQANIPRPTLMGSASWHHNRHRSPASYRRNNYRTRSTWQGRNLMSALYHYGRR